MPVGAIALLRPNGASSVQVRRKFEKVNMQYPWVFPGKKALKSAWILSEGAETLVNHLSQQAEGGAVTHHHARITAQTASTAFTHAQINAKCVVNVLGAVIAACGGALSIHTLSHVFRTE